MAAVSPCAFACAAVFSCVLAKDVVSHGVFTIAVVLFPDLSFKLSTTLARVFGGCIILPLDKLSGGFSYLYILNHMKFRRLGNFQRYQ